MPKKNKDKYPRYEDIKQFYVTHSIQTDFADLGKFFSDDWNEWFDEATPILTTNTEKLDQERIYGLGFTNNVFEEDQSELLKKGKKAVAGMEKKVKDFNGPFKEMLESWYYVSNPNNGDMLELLIDQPSLERILISPFGDMPQLTNKVIKDGKAVFVIDAELNQKRKEALGDFYGLYTNLFKSAKEFTQVLYERQKAEAKGETGLDTIYAAKYASALDSLVDSFDQLKSAAEIRYNRTDLDKIEKDLEYIKGTNVRILNNDLAETTTANPDKISRNASFVAVANLRAQSKAIKNGWTITEARLMGVLGEAVANAENSVRNAKLNIKNDKGKIREYEKKIEVATLAGKDTQSIQKSIENVRAEIKKFEAALEEATNTLTEAQALYGKYADLKKPDWGQRQDILKDTKNLLNKHKDSLHISNMSFKAAEDKLSDPYDYKEKTRLEQAEDMLKSLNDVDMIGRSSDNFRELKASVKKLVEMAREYPAEMTEEQFHAYEQQAADVRKKADKYLKGKEKENTDYKAAHNGEDIKRSEYTSKRINTVRTISDRILTHLSLNSGEHTKEYTGTPDERAVAKYERRIREEAEKRKSILGKGYLGMTSGEESYNMSKELNSFCRSVYIEKMKERYEFDPDFSAQDLIDSLEQSKINAGGKEELTILKENKAYRIHMIGVMRDRIEMDADGELETYDDRDYLIGGDIPEGVGQDWVRYELKNYRAMYHIPEPSAEDYLEDEEENENEIVNDVDDKKAEEKKAEVKEEKKPEGLQDNLAGKIYAAMEDDQLLYYSQDPQYKEIAKEFSEHSAKEEPGKNTKVPVTTMLKMARYIDKMHDIKKPNEDDVSRRNIVQSAFDQYKQKDEKFEQTSGEFMFKAPKFDPIFGYNHGEGYYKGLFYKVLGAGLKMAGEAYQANPENEKIAQNLTNKAYQVLLTEVVENTIAKEKGVPYDTINSALHSTADPKKIDEFINDHVSPQSFKKNFEKLVKDEAKNGEINPDTVSDCCDKAIAMTLDDAKKNKDVQSEVKAKNLIEKLKRNPKTIENFREKAPEQEKVMGK